MYELIELARFTSDVSAATRFYEQLLDCKPDNQHEGMSEFRLGDIVLRIHQTYDAQEGELS